MSTTQYYPGPVVCWKDLGAVIILKLSVSAPVLYLEFMKIDSLYFAIKCCNEKQTQ